MWVLPTSFVDPDSAWSNEANAYDGDTDTYAQGASGSFLELHRMAVNCSTIRLWAERAGPGTNLKCDIDLYYNGGWNHLFDDTWGRDEWGFLVELEIGSTEIVSAARIEGDNGPTDIALFTFEFEARKGFVG